MPRKLTSRPTASTPTSTMPWGQERGPRKQRPMKMRADEQHEEPVGAGARGGDRDGRDQGGQPDDEQHVGDVAADDVSDGDLAMPGDRRIERDEELRAPRFPWRPPSARPAAARCGCDARARARHAPADRRRSSGRSGRRRGRGSPPPRSSPVRARAPAAGSCALRASMIVEPVVQGAGEHRDLVLAFAPRREDPSLPFARGPPASERSRMGRARRKPSSVPTTIAKAASARATSMMRLRSA